MGNGRCQKRRGLGNEKMKERKKKTFKNRIFEKGEVKEMKTRKKRKEKYNIKERE